jgi:uncharacterized protein (DUF302 family)
MKFLSKLFMLFAFAFSLSYGDVVVIEIKDYKFNDAMDDLKDSILNTGTKISETRHIEKMLKRTKQKGEKDIYKYGMAYSFCKANLSRAMMRLHPSNIANCPFTISVYQTINSKKLFVSYRIPILNGDKTKAIKVTKLIDDYFKTLIEESF